MREIRFRAWNKCKELMCYDYESPLVYHCFSAFVPTGEGGSKEHFEQEWVLMQFTGIVDKHNHKIYEGDIITFPNLHGHELSPCIAQVIWYKAGWAYQYPAGGVHGLGTLDNIEIIGNIHANPEVERKPILI